MSARSVLDALQAKGIELWAEGEKLRFRAPDGALGEAERLAVAEHRQALLDLLRGAGDAFLSLNDLQQAYLLAARHPLTLGGVDAVYCLELHTPALDPQRLQQALQRMVEQHPALRGVLQDDTTLRLYRHVTVPALEIHDLRTREQPSAALNRLREALIGERRDYARWPLFDIRLVRLADEDWRLLIRIELLVLDAWSGYRFIQQWLGLYAEQAWAETFPGLSPVDLRAQELHEQSDPRWRAAQHWWRQRLRDLPPAPALALRMDPRQASAHLSRRAECRLPAAPWQQLKALCREQGVTASDVLLAVFVDTLACWGDGGDEMLLNLTLFQRAGEHPQREAVLGDFTRLMTLACPVREPGESAFSHTRRVQARLWETLEQSRYSGVQVLRELAPVSAAHAVLGAPVVFTSLLFERDGQAFNLAPDGWQQTWALSRTPQVVLDFQLYEDRGELALSWDYVADLFEPGVVDRVLAAYSRQVLNLAAGEEQPLLLEPELRLGAWRLGQVEALTQTRSDPAQLASARRTVAACWSELLGRTIDPERPLGFLEAGGSSLLVARLQASLSVAFGREVPIAALFQHATVAAQARLLCRIDSDVPAPRQPRAFNTLAERRRQR